MATKHASIASYVCVGLAIGTVLGILACTAYRKICLPLRSRLRARRRVGAAGAAQPRPMFRGSSTPAGPDGGSAGLPGRDPPPPPYQAWAAAVAAPPLAPHSRDPRPPSYADATVWVRREDCAAPGDWVARVALPSPAPPAASEPTD